MPAVGGCQKEEEWQTVRGRLREEEGHAWSEAEEMREQVVGCSFIFAMWGRWEKEGEVEWGGRTQRSRDESWVVCSSVIWEFKKGCLSRAYLQGIFSTGLLSHCSHTVKCLYAGRGNNDKEGFKYKWQGLFWVCLVFFLSAVLCCPQQASVSNTSSVFSKSAAGIFWRALMCRNDV